MLNKQAGNVQYLEGDKMNGQIRVEKMSEERWDDLVKLFGAHGASGGCWCMYFREAGNEFRANKGAANQNLFHNVVQSGQPVGLIAYCQNEPAGWIAMAPREAYPRILKSRNYKPVDDAVVWSITCFYTARKFRGNGLTRSLIQGALDFASANGVEWVEAYPVDTRKAKIQDASAYTGIFEPFIELGFTEIARRSPSAPIVRYHIIYD
jgi:GNAT superfamily N-acetyltransferase